MLGPNGLIARAQQASTDTQVASILERMEIAKGAAYANEEARIDPDDYFEILEQEGIINDKDTDIVDKGNGQYEVTTSDGHVVNVTEIPNGDLNIEYAGPSNGPIISNIKITQTTNSITVEVETSNATDVKYSYLYKKDSEGEESWKEAEVQIDNNTTTISGLQAGETYNIKVKIETSEGSKEKTVNVKLESMPSQDGISFGSEVVWQEDGTASILVSTTEEGYKLQYQINGTEADGWIDIESGENISGLHYGDEVFVRLWDETNESEYASTTIGDEILPIISNVEVSEVTYNSITVKVTANDNQSGIQTYEYYLNDETEPRGTSEDNTFKYTKQGSES